MPYTGYHSGMSSLSPIAARPENLTEQVFQRIQESIVDQTLAPGTRVSEASIAALLDVSKTPVREALLRLRYIGLVEQTGTGRLRVIDPSSKEVRDAYEFRAMIERSAAYEAAGRISTVAADQLLEYAQDTVIMAKAQTGKGYRDTDRRFHLAVATATTNGVLHEAVGNALVLTSALREREVPMAEEFLACATEHVGIAELVATGNQAAAADAMNAHVLHVMAQVLQTRSPSTAAAQPAREALGVRVRR
ncbi:putative GntR-family transcriptional regulator [metagenome]|uniref:Putative GntR-family transcriptional regulator n=1 Tax=metagenome TaxID=256318 RepID=A0A2P2C279_9ZZZZ